MDAADELGGNEMRRISKAETGKRIRKLLVESGITVREVQEAMELESPQAVYKWLNGKALPSTENLLILSEMLRMPMEQILVLDRSKVSEGCLWRLWKYPPVIWSYLKLVQQLLIGYIEHLCQDAEFNIGDEPLSAFNSLYCIFIQIEALYLEHFSQFSL